MSAPAPVTLYTRAGCPLCDEARALLDALATDLGFAIETVDVVMSKIEMKKIKTEMNQGIL